MKVWGPSGPKYLHNYNTTWWIYHAVSCRILYLLSNMPILYRRAYTILERCSMWQLAPAAGTVVGGPSRQVRQWDLHRRRGRRHANCYTTIRILYYCYWNDDSGIFNIRLFTSVEAAVGNVVSSSVAWSTMTMRVFVRSLVLGSCDESPTFAQIQGVSFGSNHIIIPQVQHNFHYHSVLHDLVATVFLVAAHIVIEAVAVFYCHDRV